MKELKIEKNGEILIITKSSTETNGEITEFEGKEQPGIGPPKHVHFKQEEMVEVLTGKMRIKTDKKEFSIGPGENYTFKPGEPHRFWNEGTELMHYRGHVKPAGNYEYFIEQVYNSANEANDDKPSAFDAAFLLTKYKSEMDILEIPKPVKIVVFPILLLIGKMTGRFKKFYEAPEAIED